MVYSPLVKKFLVLGLAASAENIELNDVENGLYAVAVHGYSVSGEVQFWIDINLIGGDKLVITEQIELTNIEINSIWPNGLRNTGRRYSFKCAPKSISHSKDPRRLEFGKEKSRSFLLAVLNYSFHYTYELLEIDSFSGIFSA